MCLLDPILNRNSPYQSETHPQGTKWSERIESVENMEMNLKRDENLTLQLNNLCRSSWLPFHIIIIVSHWPLKFTHSLGRISKSKVIFNFIFPHSMKLKYVPHKNLLNIHHFILFNGLLCRIWANIKEFLSYSFHWTSSKLFAWPIWVNSTSMLIFWLNKWFINGLTYWNVNSNVFSKKISGHLAFF